MYGEYISQQDAEWVSAPRDAVTPFMEKIISNTLSDIFRDQFLRFWEKQYGYRLYGEAFITNAYGVNVAQTGKTTDYYQADEEWWQKAKSDGFFVVEVEYDESAGAWTMPFAVRVDDRDGKFLGVIKAVPLIREIAREVELTTKKYRTTELRLADQEGRLIYSSKAFQMLEDVSDKEFFQKARGDSGFFSVTEGERGKLFTYARSQGFRGFQGLQWVLVMSHDTAEVFAPVRELQRSLGIIAVIFVLAAGFFAAVLSRAISRPIKKLTESASSIAQGNLDVNIDIYTHDEIGQLSSSFREMTQKLKASYQNLEEKIRMRTEELQKQIQELDRVAKLLVRRDFELMQANELLREMDRIKSEFVSIAAHQLRTPLAGIKWTVYSLLEKGLGRLNAEQKKFATDAYRATNRLIDLVNDLLDVARLEEGKTGFRIERHALIPVVKKISAEFKRAAAEKGIKFFVELPESGVPLFNFDEEKIGIVLGNLLDNAVKYTPPGGNITVRVKKEKNHIAVEVRDTGIGIPKEQASRVFSKFFRGANAQLQQTNGTGFGLYVVKNIIDHHKGKVSFQSEENRGSAFFFTLPLSS